MSGQFGLTLEDTWGVPKTVDTFVPVLSAVPDIDEGYMRPKGISSRLTQSPLQLGPRTVTAKTELELPNLGIAELLTLMFGTANNSGGSTTYTPGTLNESATVQVGIQDAADTVQPFTLYGAKVTGWALSCQVGTDGFAKLSLDWSAKDATVHRSVTDAATTSGDATLTSSSAAFTVGDLGKPISGTGIPAGTTIAAVTSATEVELSANASATGTGVTVAIGVALATESLPAGLAPFSCIHAALTIAGTEAASARQLSLSGANNLKVDRHRFGSRFIREQRQGPERRSFTGSFVGDFDDLTMFRRAAAASQLALVVAFDNGSEQLDITTNVQLTKPSQGLTGNGLEEQTVPFECVGDTDAETISVVLTNSETE
ncbi:MAG TPA: phage tail tube protein [Acidimicrobiales bacterium]|nr:phage tail tube protein [Acidimicrobiales bacterium]